ncbi:MAG: hypothetical protein DDT21_02290 [Syntrophomonadaceae bacterium]|nr:hypothetical protein [Bacillota bacterium]
MNTLVEFSPYDLTVTLDALSWTGLQPGYVLTNENAATLLSYCGGLASAAVWVATDVGVWKRNQLRRLYTVGSDQYNEAVGNLYTELSEYIHSVQSEVSWRSYLNVAERVAYEDRVASFGPAVYIPAMSLSPDAFDSFVLAVKEGEHKTFLAQFYGKQVNATRVASTSANDYGPHTEDLPDDVPFSSSGSGVVAEAEEWIEEYERKTAYLDSQIDTDLMAEVADLLRYAKFYCQEPYSDEEDEFWKAEIARCDVAIARINELLA